MTLDGLTPLVRWLASTPMSSAIGGAAWITPAVQCVHILAIAIVMACMTMTNMRILGAVGRDEGVASIMRRYGSWIWPALLLLLLTGSILIVGEPRRSLQNYVFVTKMALVCVAAGLTLGLQWPLGADPTFWEGGARRRLAQGVAVLSILVWVAIVFAGRWIAYAQE